MPKFYFHLLNDVDAPDDEGVELPSLEVARAHGIKEARATFGETAKEMGRVVLHHRIDIEDAQGAVLDTVYFREAVSVEDSAFHPLRALAACIRILLRTNLRAGRRPSVHWQVFQKTVAPWG